MSPVAFADRSKLSLLSLRRAIDHAVGRARARWLMLPSLPDRLVIAPQDLRTADPTRGAEIASGRFAFAGKIVLCDGRSPFEILPPSDEWQDILLGFSWLRHLRADTPLARANARTLVDEWITGRWHEPAWRPEVVSRRIISWLSHATLILDESDMPFYRRFVRSLGRQVRFLRSTARDARDGVPRLQARLALVYASLCIASQLRHGRKASRQLAYELERQILPDGGHASRNPAALIELLLDLLPLSQAYAARNLAPPPALLNAVDRMMPMLRFFRHADGSFALFNGMGPTPPDLLATLLAYDDAHGAPVANAVHSGYQRVEAGGTLILLDTGRAPPLQMSTQAHAGCLSFEMSVKGQRVVVNCGLPHTGKDSWRDLARATSAHSTITFADASSCQFLEASATQRQYGNPITDGPRRVPVTREMRGDGEMVRALHDGYAGRFGVIHQRSLVLSPDGTRLDGEDLLLPAEGDALPPRAPDAFAARFHLHPLIKATPDPDGHGVALILPNREAWHFEAYQSQVEIEESAYLGGQDGPRRALQLVLRGHARETPRVRWTFSRAPAPRPARRQGGEEAELPL